MGQGQSTPVQTQVEVKPPQPNVVDTSSAPVVEVKPTPVATETSKCPVSAYAKKDEQSKLSALCPIKKEAKPADATTVAAPTEAAKSPAEPECPVVYKNPNVYNVYNQKIDPKNQMPAQANQVPAPGQSVDLSKEREPSSIPKGGTDSTWVYPSPQMFWNALVRKNKVEGALEEDMESVVRIHNSMNEATWLKVLEWEKLHPVKGPGMEPKLLRFLGRPDELSPKALLKTFVGHAAPFDRHDWIVDRGGTEVRYIIDYYHDEARAAQDKTPKNKHDQSSIKSIKLDVRPAIDSPEALIDRLVIMPYSRFTGKSQFQPLPFFPESETVIAERKRLEIIQNSWRVIQQNCAKENENLRNCQSERECQDGSIKLQACIAGVVCPTIAKDFRDSLDAQPFDADKTDKIYESMVKCVELFELDSKAAFSKNKGK